MGAAVTGRSHALKGRIAFKTGTPYGFRDALAIGFDPRTAIAVWVGRPATDPTHGLIGHDAAAPILFHVFERLGEASNRSRRLLFVARPCRPS